MSVEQSFTSKVVRISKDHHWHGHDDDSNDDAADDDHAGSDFHHRRLQQQQGRKQQAAAKQGDAPRQPNGPGKLKEKYGAFVSDLLGMADHGR